MGAECGTHEEGGLVGKYDGKRPLVIKRHKLENRITIDLNVIR